MGEINIQVHDNVSLPMPIAEMESGYFWAKLSSLGGTAVSAAELHLLYTAAKNSLSSSDVPGIRPWMTARRAVC